MARIYKDGWHEVYGIDVYVEDNMVVRAVDYRQRSATTLYPYMSLGRHQGWTNVSRMVGLDAFRVGLKRGAYILR